MTDAAVLTYIELPPGDERRLPPLQTVVAAVRAGELSLQQRRRTTSQKLVACA
jgi:hypothetical protein